MVVTSLVNAPPPLSDKKQRPTEDSIGLALGRAAGAWRVLFEQLRASHPELEATWRYYDDGKRWLLKLTRKSKTLCWVAVERGSFRVGFYFAERLTKALLASELSAERKSELRSSKSIGKLRPVGVTFGPRRGVRDVLTLLSLKDHLR
jgi:hypothetical protein